MNPYIYFVRPGEWPEGDYVQLPVIQAVHEEPPPLPWFWAGRGVDMKTRYDEDVERLLNSSFGRGWSVLLGIQSAAGRRYLGLAYVDMRRGWTTLMPDATASFRLVMTGEYRLIKPGEE